MNLIQRILGHSDGLVCPRCERSLEGHDDGDCARRMSRRYFFGLGAAAIALGMAPKLPTISNGDFNPAIIEALDRYVQDLRGGYIVDPGGVRGIYYFNRPTNYFTGLKREATT